MRTNLVFSCICLFGFIACNSGNDKSSGSDTAAASKSDTNMKKAADTVKMVAALPMVPKDAKVFFKNLKNDETVKSPFKVEMGARDIKVDSAGLIIPGEGHFHLLIDAGDSVAAGIVIPKDASHLHYGKGEKVAVLMLSPGKHRLAIQFADGIHRSYGSKLAVAIDVKVK